MSYQGWANHATWVVHLHLANDEGLYLGAKEVIYRTPKHATETLRDFVTDLFESLDIAEEPYRYKDQDSQAGMRTDLIRIALNEVDWYAIVEALTEE